MNETFEYLMERALKDALESRKVGLLGGTLEDYPAYKYQCGLIHGIQFAIDQLVELRGKVLQDAGFE